jgi:hypothetical protein
MTRKYKNIIWHVYHQIIEIKRIATVVKKLQSIFSDGFKHALQPDKSNISGLKVHIEHTCHTQMSERYKPGFWYNLCISQGHR